MKQLVLLLFFPLILSCGSVPDPQDIIIPPVPEIVEVIPIEIPAQPIVELIEPEPIEPALVEPGPDELGFHPETVSHEMYETTKVDIQALVGELNRIIRSRNFNAWLEYLADSYREEISSPAFLEEKTEELYRRDQIVASNMGRDPRAVQKRILLTPRDYFDNVVVPSRSNDRVDDITFVDDTNVKAYTIDSRGNRLILYDLVIIDQKWKIIN
jgi:hypothetical protein